MKKRNFNFFDWKWAANYIKNELHMNFLEFSRQTGINKSSIHAYLNGTQIPSLYNLVQMADVMGVTVDECLLSVEEEWENAKKH